MANQILQIFYSLFIIDPQEFYLIQQLQIIIVVLSTNGGRAPPTRKGGFAQDTDFT